MQKFLAAAARRPTRRGGRRASSAPPAGGASASPPEAVSASAVATSPSSGASSTPEVTPDAGDAGRRHRWVPDDEAAGFRTMEPLMMQKTPQIAPGAGDADDWFSDGDDDEFPGLAQARRVDTFVVETTIRRGDHLEGGIRFLTTEPPKMQDTPQVTPRAGDADGDCCHDERPTVHSIKAAELGLPPLGLKDLAEACQGAVSRVDSRGSTMVACTSDRPPTVSTCSGDAENPSSERSEELGFNGLPQGISLRRALACLGTPCQGASMRKSECPLASPLWPGDVENPPAARREDRLPSDASKAQSERDRDASKASSTTDPTSCKLWRLIAARRRMKMKQHHGHTLLHKAAWYAECITCTAFSVACFVMLCLWARHENEESFVNTFFVTAIAAMTYFAKSCHMGDIVYKGDLVPIARYIDWITTTPLLMYELCHIAHATTPMLIMVIMSDVLMIATGIMAALIPWKTHKGVKQYWFFASCFFYILLLVVLHIDVGYKASKQIEVAANLFKQLEMLTVIVWSFYPIIVGIGRAHLGLITKPTEDICLCILDVMAKIGTEGLIVASCFHGCIEEAPYGAH